MQQFKMKIKLTYIVLLLFLFSCSDSTENKERTDNLINQPLDEKLTILNDTSYLIWITGINSELWTPSEKDFRQIDLIIKNAIQNGEFDFLKEPKFENIKKYYRQYICYINENREKVIYINAFCDILETPTEIEGEISIKLFDWKNELLIVDDGGMCYWSIKINLSTNKYFDFYVNGVA